MREDIRAFLIVVILVILGYAGVKVWTLGSRPSDWTLVCIQGQEYHVASFGVKGMAALKVDDEGRPVPCERQ